MAKEARVEITGYVEGTTVPTFEIPELVWVEFFKYSKSRWLTAPDRANIESFLYWVYEQEEVKEKKSETLKFAEQSLEEFPFLGKRDSK